MIVKMEFVTITGHKNEIDRIANRYLSKYEIQLENALSELKTVDNLVPFIEANPYTEPLDKANRFISYLEDKETTSDDPMSQKEMFSVVREAMNTYIDFREQEEQLKEQQTKLRERLRLIDPFRPVDFNIKEILQYHFIKFRFGRIALDYYHKLEKYLHSDFRAVFLEGGRDTSYVYGVYFASQRDIDKQDAIFKSLHFERIFVPDEYNGTPRDACR